MHQNIKSYLVKSTHPEYNFYHELSQKGGYSAYYQKYLKYKQKYLQLKNHYLEP